MIKIDINGLRKYQKQYLDPFFALSLYNFIPACNTCNSLMK